MKINRPTWLALSLFAVIATAYLYVSQMEKRPPTIFQPPAGEDEGERVQKAIDLGGKNQKEIASILYSDLSKEEILEKLKPYVKIGDPMENFENRIGNIPGFGFGFGSGPRNSQSKSAGYNFFCGLEIGTDDNGNVRSIARSKNTLNNKDYERLQIAP